MAPDETNDSVPPDSLSPAYASKATSSQPRAPSPPKAPAEARPSSTEAPGDDPLADVPELVTTVATSQDDKIAALKLVADSVAQQRQAASWALLSHPTMLAVYVGLMAVVSHFVWRTAGDWPRLLTTAAGVTMTLLVAVRLVTGRYISLAEEINWSFLDDADSIIVTRFGERIIGVLVLGWAGPNMQGNRAQRRRKGKGVIKAWTVLLKYRGKGVGLGLLEEAVRETVQRGGEGVEFADEHASTCMVTRIWNVLLIWYQTPTAFCPPTSMAPSSASRSARAKPCNPSSTRLVPLDAGERALSPRPLELPATQCCVALKCAAAQHNPPAAPMRANSQA